MEKKLTLKIKKGDWSEKEELKIFMYIKKYKCSWIKISSMFKNRTRVSIRNKFINSLKLLKFEEHNNLFKDIILKQKVTDLGRIYL